MLEVFIIIIVVMSCVLEVLFSMVLTQHFVAH